MKRKFYFSGAHALSRNPKWLRRRAASKFYQLSFPRQNSGPIRPPSLSHCSSGLSPRRICIATTTSSTPRMERRWARTSIKRWAEPAFRND